MRLRHLSLSWCVLMCTLAPAKAHEVQIGVETGLAAESNVLKLTTRDTPDGFFSVTPTITFAQPESDFTYDLEYRPTYTGYFDTDGINGVDHVLRGRTAYQIDGRNTLRASADFFRVRAIRSDNFLDPAGQPFAIASATGKNQRFVVDAGIDHSFSASTIGRLTLDYNRWDYTESNRVDNQGIGILGELTHAPRKKWTVGASVSGRYTAFDETTLSPASFTTVVNANAIASYEVNDRLVFRVSGGPAGVFTRQSEPAPRFVSRWSPLVFDPIACNPGPCGRVWGNDPVTTPFCGTALGSPILRGCATGTSNFINGRLGEQKWVTVGAGQNLFGRATDNLTYFFSVSLDQRFRTGGLVLSFVRNEDAGAGIGASTILNSGSIAFSRSLTDRWRLRIVGIYTLRQSVAQLPISEISAVQSADPTAVTAGGNPQRLAEASAIVASLVRQDFEQTIATAEVSLVRNLSEHSRLLFRFRYYDQQQDSIVPGSDNGFDNFTGGIFYIYEFDPYKL